MKSCGECILCCKLFAIEELDKPRNCWCPHAEKGKGCTIYEDRPKTCREFECLWLQHPQMPVEMRPDKIHAVFTGTTTGGSLCVHLDPGYPTAHMQEPLKSFLDRLMGNGVKVIVVRGQHMYYYRGGRWVLGEVTVDERGQTLRVPAKNTV